MVDSVQLIGVKETFKELKAVEPTVYKQLIKDIRKVAKPAASKIRSAIPAVAPLSGMNHNGKSAWSGVKVSTRVTPSGRAGFGSTEARLVQIQTQSTGTNYGVEMADMAGRGSGTGRRPSNMSKPFERNGKTMQYTKNGQGQAMIRNLPAKASRYIYPAAESVVPQIQIEVLKIIDDAALLINRKLDRI